VLQQAITLRVFFTAWTKFIYYISLCTWRVLCYWLGITKAIQPDITYCCNPQTSLLKPSLTSCNWSNVGLLNENQNCGGGGGGGGSGSRGTGRYCFCCCPCCSCSCNSNSTISPMLLSAALSNRAHLYFCSHYLHTDFMWITKPNITTTVRCLIMHARVYRGIPFSYKYIPNKYINK